MKIYFCDECNESIPLQDIKDSKAITLKGKIYCQNCNPLKEMVSEKGQIRSARFSNLLLFLVAALLVVVICLMLFYKGGLPENSVDTYKLDQAISQVDLRLQNHFEDLIQREAEAMRTSLDEQDEKFSKLESELMELRGDLLGLRSENENMSKNFQTVTNFRQRLDQLILKQDEFSADLEANEKTLGRFKSQLTDLDLRQEKLAQAVQSGVLVAVGDGDEWEERSEQDSDRLQALKKKLASSDAGDRFEAVYRVLDERIKEVLADVLPLIEDPDQFVQVGAIQAVGEFLYQEAVPALVKVLRDPDSTVRDEALRQLIRMTGQNQLNFDVRGSESEKEKAVKKWEKWLKTRK